MVPRAAHCQKVNIKHWPQEQPDSSSFETREGDATITRFDWQKAWGSIHLNSFADGLNDPVSKTTPDGDMPCDQNTKANSFLCPTTFISPPRKTNTHYPELVKKGLSDIMHGIKFDIKNSVANCMSWILPTEPIANGMRTGIYDAITCGSNYLDKPVQPLNEIPVGWKPIPGSYDRMMYNPENNNQESNVWKPTLVRAPIWFEQSLDDLDRNAPNGDPVGCQQQVVNNCINDIHDCVEDTGNGRINLGKHKDHTYTGYKFPVTHVFTPQEVADLGGRGTPLPEFYYRYYKIIAEEKLHDSSDPTKAAADEIIYKKEYCDQTTQQNTNIDKQNNTGGVDLVGAFGACPNKKYSYVRLKFRSALSLTSTPKDAVPNSLGSHFRVEGPFEAYDPALAKIKAYAIKMPHHERGGNGEFIIVDPSGFFDLRLYPNYMKNKKNLDKNGNPKSLDTCPIVGIEGYGGICDPTGNAGCNVPIYKVGGKTVYRTSTNEQYSSNPFTVVWSSYVKKWAFISVEQYWENVKDRKGVNGGRLYQSIEELTHKNALDNRNPILQLTYADGYCTIDERYSTQVPLNTKTSPPDLPCVRYLQYQNIDPVDDIWQFVDLYSPEKDLLIPSVAGYKTINLFSINDKGEKIPNPGTGDNSLLKNFTESLSETQKQKIKNETGNVYASFFDTAPTDQYSNYVKSANGKMEIEKDGNKKIIKRDIVNDGYKPMAGKPPKKLLGKKNKEVTGEIRTEKAGNAILAVVAPDTAVAIQFPHLNGSGSAEPGEPFENSLKEPLLDAYCIVITNTGLENIFIPTYSKEEFQNFATLNQKEEKQKPGLKTFKSRKCIGKFQTYAHRNNIPVKDRNAPPIGPNGTYTWHGKLSCSELAPHEKPACNQVALITAKRYCLLENGALAGCELCLGSAEKDDPDRAIMRKVYQKKPGTQILTSIDSQCYFQAACTAVNSPGCPTTNNGGHVFCVAPDTKIMMADGTQKEIKDIKAGEEVMSFESKLSKDKNLKTSKVVATTTTEDQAVIKINNLEITPDHKIILSSGRAVKAGDINLGSKILKEDGRIEIVQSIDKKRSKIKVYNLVLEDGSDGYIANGVRVLSYPMLKGLKKKP